MTANALTNLLILAIPRDIPGARAWRSNQGGAYPAATIRAALHAGSYEATLAILRSARLLRFGLPGLPDIDGFLPGGRRLGVEVKIGRDQQSEAQKACEGIYNRARCVYVVARDEGADPVGNCIEEITQRIFLCDRTR
jgi:hypothetical protein